MDLSTQITDGIILLRPFHLDDTKRVFEAVRESLTELKPWMSWAHDGYLPYETEDYIRITRIRWDEDTLYASSDHRCKNRRDSWRLRAGRQKSRISF